MAHGVVDILEPVQIHEQDRQALARHPGTHDFLVDAIEERLPVGQTSQAVEVGQPSNAGLGDLALGDLARQNNETGFVTGNNGLARNRQLEPQAAHDQWQFELRAARGAVIQGSAQGCHAHFCGRARQYLVDGLAEKSFWGRRQEIRAWRAVVDVASVDIQFEKQVRDGVQDRCVARLGGMQVLHRLMAAKQIAHPVADQRPVDRLGDEVGRTRLVGGFDGLQIVHAGHHDDGQQGSRRNTQYRTNLVPSQAGHVDIQHDHVARFVLEFMQCVLAALSLAHVVAGLAQRGAHHKPRVRVVVDD